MMKRFQTLLSNLNSRPNKKRATINYLLRDMRAAIGDCRRTLKLNPSHFGALSG
jgi:hypothetical protein